MKLLPLEDIPLGKPIIVKADTGFHAEGILTDYATSGKFCEVFLGNVRVNLHALDNPRFYTHETKFRLGDRVMVPGKPETSGQVIGVASTRVMLRNDTPLYDEEHNEHLDFLSYHEDELELETQEGTE